MSGGNELPDSTLWWKDFSSGRLGSFDFLVGLLMLFNFGKHLSLGRCCLQFAIPAYGTYAFESCLFGEASDEYGWVKTWIQVGLPEHVHQEIRGHWSFLER